MLTWEIYTNEGDDGARQVARSSEFRLSDGETYRYEIWEYAREEGAPNVKAELYQKVGGDIAWDLAAHITMGRNTCLFQAIAQSQAHYAEQSA